MHEPSYVIMIHVLITNMFDRAQVWYKLCN